MTAAAQDTFDDILGAVLSDWRPSRVESREAIRKAVMAAAAERHGLVHIAAVRRHLPPWCDPASIGAVMNRLVRRGYLSNTGKYEPNGDPNPKARNAAKPAPVRKLLRPIPPDAL